MPFKFKKSPDRMRIDSMVELDSGEVETFSYCHPTRYSVATSELAAGNLFDALRYTVADPSSQDEIFQKYRCKLLGRPLSVKDIRALRAILAEHDQWRLKTFAGRVWKNIKNKHIGQFHAISTWARAKQLWENDWILCNLLDYCKLDARKCPIYYEGILFNQPQIYRSVIQNSVDEDCSRLASNVDRGLSLGQIMNILVKANAEPYSLTVKEREVAFELRHIKIPEQYRQLITKDDQSMARMSTREIIAWRSGLLES